MTWAGIAGCVALGIYVVVAVASYGFLCELNGTLRNCRWYKRRSQPADDGLGPWWGDVLTALLWPAVLLLALAMPCCGDED